MNWDVFISHASEDKKFARDLAERLTSSGYRVWLDTSELTLGDSLRAKIDEGLAQSRYGVVILSPAFFDKHWPTRELNALAAREEEGKKVILPVWHHVDHDVVRRASPMLADRLAVRTDEGVDAVAEEIARVLQKSIENGDLGEAIRQTVRDAARAEARRRSFKLIAVLAGAALIATIAAGLYWTRRESPASPQAPASVGSVPATPAPAAPELVGRVTDQHSRKPVDAAKVSIDGGGGIPRVLYTDSEGIFRVEAPSRGARLRVEHDGFETYERLIGAGASGSAEDIRLKPLAPPKPEPVRRRTFAANGMFPPLEFRGTVERTEADAFYEYRPHLEVIFHQSPQLATQKIQFARIAATIPAGPGQPAIVLADEMQPAALEFSTDGERKALPQVVLRLERAKADAAAVVGLALMSGTSMFPVTVSLK